MKKKTLKTRKSKNFNLTLNCQVINEVEFIEKFRIYYKFITCTYTPRRVDKSFKQRSFYMLYNFAFLCSFNYGITFEDYVKLPRFICVEGRNVYFHPNCRD